MKLQDIKKIIKEALENEQPHKLEKDELGKFFVVTKPSQPKEENCYETNIVDFANKIKSGELDETRIVGVYTKSGSAKSKAKEMLDEIETEMNELKTHMEDFRAKKAEIEEKKAKAAEIIKKYKINESLDLTGDMTYQVAAYKLVDYLQTLGWANFQIKDILKIAMNRPSIQEARFEKGTDIGNPGKGFAKVAKTAAKQYGSKKAGERVAGAILQKILAKKGK